MDEKTREFLEGVYPYFRILESANKKLVYLIDNSFNNLPHENEEFFYQITSDVIRLYPYSRRKKEIKCDSGILLLRQHMPFIKEDYQKLLQIID